MVGKVPCVFRTGKRTWGRGKYGICDQTRIPLDDEIPVNGFGFWGRPDTEH
jgi:hypothetical protein